MAQHLIEIVNRREEIITNTDSITVQREVINMGMIEAFDFMVEMCINVYHLDLPSILGPLV